MDVENTSSACTTTTLASCRRKLVICNKVRRLLLVCGIMMVMRETVSLPTTATLLAWFEEKSEENDRKLGAGTANSTTNFNSSKFESEQFSIPNAEPKSNPNKTTSNVTVAPVESPEEQQQQQHKSAVVWATIGVTTDCEAARLKHLVETAGVDVWVLHAHYLLDENQTRLSNDNIASIPNLHSWSQVYEHQNSFNGLSGSAKTSFLRWFASHPEYAYAWHVENDVFFTGSWDAFLEPEMQQNSSYDFLTTKLINQTNNSWVWLKKKGCYVLGQECANIQSVQAGWMVARVSSQLATSLLKDVQGSKTERAVKGHHEAVLAPYTILKNFTYGLVNMSKVGRMRAGHTRDSKREKYLTVNAFDPQPNTLIHPIKCQAYRKQSIEPEIQAWLENS